MTTIRSTVAKQAVLLPFFLIAALPIYILVISAFKENQDILASPLGIPFDRLTLTNIQSALTNPTLDAGWSLVRTILITFGSVALSTVSGAMIAYVISRATRSTLVLYLFLIFGILLPSQVLLIPVVRVLAAVGLANTLVGLILYMAATQVPYAVFLYVGFFKSVPKELDEAAYVDGAGPFRTFWSIIFPMLRPATASIAIFSGLGAYSNFVDPLIILGPLGGSTITTGVYAAVGQRASDYSAVFGNLFVAVVPVMVAYVFLQRQFISGLSEGSTKG